MATKQCPKSWNRAFNSFSSNGFINVNNSVNSIEITFFFLLSRMASWPAGDFTTKLKLLNVLKWNLFNKNSNKRWIWRPKPKILWKQQFFSHLLLLLQNIIDRTGRFILVEVHKSFINSDFYQWVCWWTMWVCVGSYVLYDAGIKVKINWDMELTGLTSQLSISIYSWITNTGHICKICILAVKLPKTTTTTITST